MLGQTVKQEQYVSSHNAVMRLETQTSTATDLRPDQQALDQLRSGLPHFCHHLKGLKAMLQQMTGMPALTPSNNCLCSLLCKHILEPQGHGCSKQVLPGVVCMLGSQALIAPLLLSTAPPHEEDSTDLLTSPPAERGASYIAASSCFLGKDV